MDNKITISIEDEILSKLLKIKKDEENIEAFIERILINKVNFLELIDGYRFDLIQSFLYDKQNKIVPLTKLETKVIKKLVDSSFEDREKYVSVLELSEYGWKGKNPSIF